MNVSKRLRYASVFCSAKQKKTTAGTPAQYAVVLSLTEVKLNVLDFQC